MNTWLAIQPGAQPDDPETNDEYMQLQGSRGPADVGAARAGIRPGMPVVISPKAPLAPQAPMGVFAAAPVSMPFSTHQKKSGESTSTGGKRPISDADLQLLLKQHDKLSARLLGQQRDAGKLSDQALADLRALPLASDLSSWAAVVDSDLAGTPHPTNFAGNYKTPETPSERQERLVRLTEASAKNKMGETKLQLDALRALMTDKMEQKKYKDFLDAFGTKPVGGMGRMQTPADLLKSFAKDKEVMAAREQLTNTEKAASLLDQVKAGNPAAIRDMNIVISQLGTHHRPFVADAAQGLMALNPAITDKVKQAYDSIIHGEISPENADNLALLINAMSERANSQIDNLAQTHASLAPMSVPGADPQQFYPAFKAYGTMRPIAPVAPAGQAPAPAPAAPAVKTPDDYLNEIRGKKK